jgi:hypothetical protein
MRLLDRLGIDPRPRNLIEVTSVFDDLISPDGFQAMKKVLCSRAPL